MSLETAVEHAKRAFALDKYEQAVDYYATALELMYAASTPNRASVDASPF
jgi:HAT1-interacting factor 1